MSTDGSSNGEYKSFVGGGFGTLLIHRAPDGAGETPAVVSSRAYLRQGLPEVYQDEDFGMRFIGALEEVLDPIVAILDALPAHFDPDLAPHAILDLLAAWLGVDLDESQPLAVQRETVRRAAELGRRRGTVAGLELALRLAFPTLPFRVEDEGGVQWSTNPDSVVQAGAPRFVVYCDEPIPPERQAEVARCIEQAKPVHTSFRLRVKSPRAS
jgi:phage tail-like protein